MTHLTEEQLRRWRSEAMPADELVAMSDHLEECDSCRLALADDRYVARMSAAIRSRLESDNPAEAHLSPEHLVSWLDGSADRHQRRLFAAHLADCSACRAAAADLRGFAASESPSAPKRTPLYWLPVAATLVAAIGVAWWWRPTASPVASPLPRSRPTLSANSPVTRPPVVLLRDGSLEVSIDQSGAILGVPSGWQERVAAVVRSPELGLPSVTLALVRPDERLRSGTDATVGEALLIEPLSCVVGANPPTFRWKGELTDEYSVEVYDSRSRLIAESGPLHSLSWRPSKAFRADAMLHWRLGHRKQDGSETFYPTPPDPPAVFRTTTTEAMQRVAAARDSGSRLLTGIALWDAGRLEEAAREFATLSRENPGSAVARRLAASSSHGAAILRVGWDQSE